MSLRASHGGTYRSIFDVPEKRLRIRDAHAGNDHVYLRVVPHEQDLALNCFGAVRLSFSAPINSWGIRLLVVGHKPALLIILAVKQEPPKVFPTYGPNRKQLSQGWTESTDAWTFELNQPAFTPASP